MGELGRRYRELFDRIAPAVDARQVAAAASERRRWAGWQIGVGAAMAAIVIGGAGYLRRCKGGQQTAATTSTTTVVTTSTTAGTTTVTLPDTVEVETLSPRIACSTAVAGFGCGNLIDGDPTTDWQAPDGGIGESISLTFDEPVTVVQIGVTGIPDQGRFLRNGRPQDLRIVGYDHGALSTVVFQLGDDNSGMQTFSLGWSDVTALTMTIQSAYPGQGYQDQKPFTELSIAEIEVRGFVGTPPGTDSTVTTVAAGSAAAIPTGTWQQTNPDLGGLYVQVRDLIWDGEAFYVLTRVGFGDTNVWRSPDGITWEDYSHIGTFGTTDGPASLVSVDGRLVAAGRRDRTATVWIDEGTTPWREVGFGQGAVRDLTFYDGRYVAVGQSGAALESTLDQAAAPAHGVVWTSPDAEAWTAVAGLDVFGDDSYPSRMVDGPAGLLVIAPGGIDPRSPRHIVVATSPDGLVWTAVDATGLAITQVDAIAGNPHEYVVYGLDSPILRSTDGVVWSPVEFDDSLVSQVSGTAFPTISGLDFFGDTLIVTGAVFADPGGGAFNYALPAVWAYRDDTWEPLGSSLWFTQPGVAYRAVAGSDRLVVWGERGTDAWALFTFVADS